MKRCVLILLLALTTRAQVAITGGVALTGGAAANGTGAAAPVYYVKQGWEGTGADNGETWSTSGSVIDMDDATGAPEGSQWCLLNGSAVRLTSPTFTSSDDGWTYFILNASTFPAAATTIFGWINASSGAFLCGVDRQSDGTVRVSGSVNGNLTTDALTTGALWYCRKRDTKGSGGNAYLSFEFSSTDSFTGSGNKFSKFDTGSETAQVNQIRFYAEPASGTVTYKVDKVRESPNQINGNPP